MLLRISLVVAILAGAASLYFSHVKVQDKINTISGERDSAQAAQANAEKAQKAAEKDRKAAIAESDKAKKALEETTVALKGTNDKLAEQEKRANQLNEDLTKMTGERNDAQTELSQWKALGVSIPEIKAFKENLAKANEERDAFMAENKVLLRKNTELQTDLSRFVGPDVEPKMPTGLVGKVIAVDPKWDFVVLNVGGNQGVVKNGRFLVDRDGKLVGKLQVTKVEPTQSIANVMQDWKNADVMEGDQVVLSR